MDVRPYGGPGGEDWFIVSDLGCAVGGAGGIGNRAEGVVLGVGGASMTLAGLTVRTPVSAALDLGTGSGIQALHAARHATRVTATDLNPRALHITALTLALSGAPAAELREGSLYEPIEDDETYDMIVSNPPFVISPGARLTYRDGGMGGDDLCRSLVQQTGERLNEGGFAHFLANWQHVEGGLDGPAALLGAARLRRLDRAARGAGRHAVRRAVAQGRGRPPRRRGRVPGAVRRGWTSSRRARSGPSASAGSPCAGPGPPSPRSPPRSGRTPSSSRSARTVRAHFDRVDYLRAHDDAALLEAHFTLAGEVVQEQVGLPGAEDPEHVVLRQNRGMRRATRVDTVGAGFAGVCDGTMSAGRILDAIAQLVGEDPVALRDRTPAQIRLLVEQGFLEPA